jgi:ProP effector
MSARLRRERVIRASAVLGAFSELWPHTFAVQGHHRKPLALGIHAALLVAIKPAIRAGTVTVKDIKAALRRYVSADGYLRACRRAGTARIDLTGKVVGIVTSAEAKYARQVLKLRKAARRANASPAPTKNGPRTAGTANGPISANVVHHEKSTPAAAGASPAA